MKLGTTITTAIALCIASTNAEGTRNLKGNGKCDLTGMYDVIETATYMDLGYPATDTAKLSLICFDDEEEFDGWGCLMDPEDCNRRRNLKESFKNTNLDGSGRKLEQDDIEQYCYFEYLGFPAPVRRGLEESSTLHADRKLQPGIHNAGFAVVFEEKLPFPTGKDKKICTAYTPGETTFLGLDAMALEVKHGVLAFETEPLSSTSSSSDESLGPYFAFKTTK